MPRIHVEAYDRYGTSKNGQNKNGFDKQGFFCWFVSFWLKDAPLRRFIDGWNKTPGRVPAVCFDLWKKRRRKSVEGGTQTRVVGVLTMVEKRDNLNS